MLDLGRIDVEIMIEFNDDLMGDMLDQAFCLPLRIHSERSGVDGGALRLSDVSNTEGNPVAFVSSQRVRR